MKFIKLEDFQNDSQIKVLSLNRPEVKNAFHPEMIQEISEFFENLNKHKTDFKLIILKGGGTAFCAGADLNWMKSMVNFTVEENLSDSKKLWTMFDNILACHIPVVGIAHGAVFGGALGLLACCDYVYAEKNTQFCFSEVKLGLSPAIISDFITRKIPDAFVRPLMLSAEVFKPEQALRIGMIHNTFEGEADLQVLLKGFQANGKEAMGETKNLLNQLLDNKKADDRRDMCARVITGRRMSAEGQERLKKFLTK